MYFNTSCRTPCSHDWGAVRGEENDGLGDIKSKWTVFSTLVVEEWLWL